MKDEKFVTRNHLERVLVEAKEGRVPMKQALALLAGSTLAIPSIAKVSADGAGFQPLLFDKRGQLMVAAFTDQTRLGRYAQDAKFSFEMGAADFLKKIPTGYGVVINPGTDLGLDLTPDGIKSVLEIPHESMGSS